MNVSLKNLLICLMFFFCLVFVVSFFLVGPSNLFDLKTCIITLAVILFLALIIKFSDSYLFIQNVIMAVFFSLFIFPRLIMYLLMPGSVKFSFGATITSGQVNNALLYLLVGTVLIFIGFLLAEKIFRPSLIPPKPTVDPMRYHVCVILGIFLATVMVNWYMRNIFGVNVYLDKDAGAHNWLMQSLLIIFNIDIVFFMACAAILFRNSFNKKILFSGFSIMLVYFIFLSFYGSRGGGMRVALVSFTILLAFEGNFKVNFRHVCFIFALLFLSYITWPLSMQKRIDTATERYMLNRQKIVDTSTSAAKNSAPAVPKKSVFALPKRINVVSKPNSEGLLLYKNFQKLFLGIMSRIGMIDNEIIILSVDAEPRAKFKYMTIAYAAKNAVNLLLPGVMFKDAETNTSRVIPILYCAFNEDYLKIGGYSSDFYTAWGIFFLIFGWWGGWCMLLVTGALIHFLYLFIMRFGNKYRYYAGALYIYSVSQMFYANMGIDHWIATSGMFAISGILTIILFESGEFIFDRTKLFLKRIFVP